MRTSEYRDGWGLRPIDRPRPLTRFLTSFETTLSRKERG
jgi:hypothetical protein